MVILYTTHCPRCKVLEKKLNISNIEYKICDDETIMTEKDIHLLPTLEVNNTLLSFKEAINWLNNRGDNLNAN